MHGVARPPGNEIGIVNYPARVVFCSGEDQLAELLRQMIRRVGKRRPSARLAAGLLIAAHIESPRPGWLPVEWGQAH